MRPQAPRSESMHYPVVKKRTCGKHEVRESGTRYTRETFVAPPGIDVMSILDWSLADTEMSVLDLETTGLAPPRHRVCEAAIVRVSMNTGPEVIFDSLIKPERPMGATFVHGIRELDVQDAPRFSDVADEILHALCGSVMCAHNVYFDLRHLMSEFERVGLYVEFPHLCAMYFRPLLSLGPRCRLEVACEEHDVEVQRFHSAGTDALATAQLLQLYLREADRRGIRTFRDLAEAGSYKFLRSFSLPVLNPDGQKRKDTRVMTKSRLKEWGLL